VQPLIDIRNVVLGYQNGHPILHLEHLSIPQGKVVFVIGPSGAGKSTLLEYLGLMSDTCLNPGEGHYTLSPGASDPVDLHDVWHQGDQWISQIRQAHFSFIFQSTNLMPNFTIGENMCFGMLMDGATQFPDAEAKVRGLMKQLDLPQDLFGKRITEASGGQRQRIAFVRAFSSPFTVLFGDEPTGNLDDGNARRLMQTLKDQTQSMGRSAVIVSHDIELSEQYADLILEIQPGSSSEPSTVQVHGQ